jgi:hypothetical protein
MSGDSQIYFHDVEVLAEFHIWRDFTFANLLLQEDERARRDAPDVVITAGQELVVCEGKFFSEFGSVDMNKQLRSQRLQVRHFVLPSAADTCLPPCGHPAVRSDWDIEADAVLTKDDIRNLVETLMGLDHYVTLRLQLGVLLAERRDYAQGPVLRA